MKPKKSKSNPTPKTINKVLIISDLHIGSAMSPIPVPFITAQGNEVKPNAVQQWLNACFDDLMGWVDAQIGTEPFALVFNGDTIDGLHHGAKEAFSPEIDDQIEAATILLAPLARRAAKRFFVLGTECHTNGFEHRIAFELNGERNPETGRCVFHRLMLQAGKHTIVCKHHIGTSMRMWTEASALASNLAEEQVQAALNKHPVPSVLVCSHRHKFGHWENAHGHCVVTPPWQCATRFAHKVVPNPIVRPGAVLLDVSGPKVRVDHITYDAPAPKPVKL
jgi:hypothetical protein